MSDDISSKVKKIVADHLGIDEAKVTEESSFIDDLGADSLDTVELVMAFEEEFGSEISDSDAEKILTVGDAVKFIENKALFSINFTASPTVRIFSASLSEISEPNSSSKAITSSTVSKLSAPKSSIKLDSSVTFASSIPRWSATIFFTLLEISSDILIL